MTPILVETQGLKRYFKTPYGKLHAVDGIDLKIEKGKVTAFRARVSLSFKYQPED